MTGPTCLFCGRALPPHPKGGGRYRDYCPDEISPCREAESALDRYLTARVGVSFPATAAGALASQARTRALLSDAGYVVARAVSRWMSAGSRRAARPVRSAVCAWCGRPLTRTGKAGQPSPYCLPEVSPCREVSRAETRWRSAMRRVRWPQTRDGQRHAEDVAARLRIGG